MLLNAQRWGQFGVIFIAAIPFVGGGIWSGVLLARLLKLNKLRAAMLLIIGSIISCVVLSVGFYGLKSYIIKVIYFLLNPGLLYSF